MNSYKKELISNGRKTIFKISYDWKRTVVDYIEGENNTDKMLVALNYVDRVIMSIQGELDKMIEGEPRTNVEINIQRIIRHYTGKV
jgi:hypothetical protein